VVQFQRHQTPLHSQAASGGGAGKVVLKQLFSISALFRESEEAFAAALVARQYRVVPPKIVIL
jgi:hypothetical protein